MSDAHSAHLWEQGKHAQWITLVQTTNTFARNIKNRFSWNWINANEIGLKQVFWTKAKASRTSRCKSGAETARWIASQCSMPLAIFSLFLLSKLVGNYIDEHSGLMHACSDRWMTVRCTGEDGKFFPPQLLWNDLVVAMWVCGCENIGYKIQNNGLTLKYIQ